MNSRSPPNRSPANAGPIRKRKKKPTDMKPSPQGGCGMELASSDVVEVRGIEPLSESVSSGTSPGADGNLHSLAQARAVTLESLVAS